MKRELLASLLDAFNRLDDRAKSGDTINCSESIMIGMAIDAINHELEKPKPEPLTPQEWWSLAPWKPMDSAPMNGTILIETAIGKVGGISYESALMKKHLFETTNAIAWLPLPEIKG